MKGDIITSERFIRTIFGKSFIKQFEHKRVVVYARTSRDDNNRRRSIDYQQTYLKQYVERNPRWRYVGSYIDIGVTGTKLNRPEFNRMMQDARDGKIDIILAKSVSRFGRNTATVLW